MTKKYDKLVRDKIPDIIRVQGKGVCFRVLEDDAEYIKALEDKLVEEVAELLESKSIEEIADVLEVMHAYKIALGFTDDEVIDVRLAKYHERGGFNNRIFLEEVDERD